MPTKSQIKKEKYPMVKLFSLINKITYTDSILKSNFLEEGNFPIISQERDFINGYSNDDKNIFNIKKPVVVFGDHTKCIKYIDFDFILGADGVKILEPNDKLFTKYLYYFLLSLNIRDLGYARHFRLIKDLNIILPPLQKQKEIVVMLDKVLGNLEKMKKNTEKNIKNSKEIFESELNAIFKNKGKDWEERRLEDVGKISMCKRIFKNQTKEKGDIPFYKIGTFGKKADAFIDRDIFEDFKKKYSYPKKGDVLISTSGTIGRVVVFDGKDAYFQDSNIVWINNKEDKILNLFLNIFYKNIKWKASQGSTIKRLYNSIIEETLISFPPPQQQKEIVSRIDELKEKTKKMEENYKKILTDIDEMKKKVLKDIFE